MSTKRIYKQDVYAVGITAEITGIRTEEEETVLTFDRTVFFPEGGGQPCDFGKIILSDGNEYSVIDVSDKDLEGDVYHTVDAPGDAFSVGDTVTLELDWERRFVNMQRHAGEHVLSGVFFNHFNGHNKGFHMGEDYIAIDIAAADAAEGDEHEQPRMYTQEEIREAERLANRVIWDDLPIETRYFADAEAARVMPARKPITMDGEISVVTIGDPASPADCCACCGTHPASTGEIGLIKIYKVETNKGMNRIFFDCGSMALARVTRDMEILSEISGRYSTSADEVLHKLDVEDDKARILREKLAGLTRYYSEKAAAEMLTEIAGCTDTGLVMTHHTDLVGADDLLKLGFAVLDKSEGLAPKDLLLCLVQEAEHTAVLVSRGSFDCGAAVKEHAFASGGRGGGRKDNARAVFTDAAGVREFTRRLINKQSVF